MLIEWLWKYEYFVNFNNMVHSLKHFSKIYLLYCNIMLFRPLLTSWFELSPPLSEVTWFLSLPPPSPSEGHWFLSWTSLILWPTPSRNNDGPLMILVQVPQWTPNSNTAPYLKNLQMKTYKNNIWSEWKYQLAWLKTCN